MATAADLLAAVRAHWQIENQLHYVRDVSLGEDASRVRAGSGPQALAALRNVAICLFDRLPTTTTPEAQQYLAARPDEAINLLLGPS
jgi:predicted transposase YbfD/YdcC